MHDSCSSSPELRSRNMNGAEPTDEDVHFRIFGFQDLSCRNRAFSISPTSAIAVGYPKFLKEETGSTLIARTAGMQQAASAVAASTMATEANVRGSVASMP